MFHVELTALQVLLGARYRAPAGVGRPRECNVRRMFHVEHPTLQVRLGARCRALAGRWVAARERGVRRMFYVEHTRDESPDGNDALLVRIDKRGLGVLLLHLVIQSRNNFNFVLNGSGIVPCSLIFYANSIFCGVFNCEFKWISCRVFRDGSN